LDFGHFSRRYKEAFGMPPSHFRAALRGASDNDDRTT
jgi:transcriptional regulator GlxA family with amidase domain